MNSLNTVRLFLSTAKRLPVYSCPLMTGVPQYSTYTVKSSRKTRRGTKAGRNCFRPIRTIVTSNQSVFNKGGKINSNLIYLTPSSEENCANKFVGSPITTLVTPRICVKPKLNQTSSNLRKIPRTIYSNSINKLSLISLNVRSVKNKSTSICDFMQSNNADLFALTETWLGSAIDKSVISEITPDGYQIFHIPRENKLGGGVALIHRSNIDVKRSKPVQTYSHFEMLECNVVVLKNCFRLCVIYSPPPSRTNKLKNSTFFEEWSEFLDRLVVTSEELVITGDLNFHLDNKNNCDTRKFQETLRDHGLVQHVRGPTHNHGHTLDVVITRENSLILKTVPSVQDPSLCDRKGNPSGDHLALFSALEISKPPRERKEVTYRKLRNISTDDIIHDLVNSEIFQNQERPLEDLVNLYSTELSSILDKHAPLISKNLILRPNTEWYTDDLRVAKRNRRKAERRMRKTKLTIHRQMFRESCITTNQLLIKCKKDYFSSKVSEIGHDQKQLHRLTNDLMGNKREIFLPEHEDDKLLADKFCEFFVGKISIIRDSLSTTNTSSSDSNPMRADIKFEVKNMQVIIELKLSFLQNMNIEAFGEASEDESQN
ncbi:unnamed protein product [Mytilus edulis]|uniref:Endonuclease/exonuclease/phosphatase domain-containing protein n=1 Tax=Mytilus edulis TaxID=6550 RepID=A0A8S3SZE0_MYTED|nr:unnamed protein product [Mytilus edulis]